MFKAVLRFFGLGRESDPPTSVPEEGSAFLLLETVEEYKKYQKNNILFPERRVEQKTADWRKKQKKEDLQKKERGVIWDEGETIHETIRTINRQDPVPGPGCENWFFQDPERRKITYKKTVPEKRRIILFKGRLFLLIMIENNKGGREFTEGTENPQGMSQEEIDAVATLAE